MASATTTRAKAAEAKAADETPATPAAAPAQAKVETEAAKKNRLTEQAMREVRDNHRDEFVAAVTRLFAAEGLEYKPRLSKEEKAREQIRRLAAENNIDLEDLLPPIEDDAPES